MARLNTRAAAPAGATRSPLRTTNTRTTTHEGGSAVTLADKTALFLMATSSFFGEDTFYEKADARAQRYGELCRSVAIQDPAWYASFVRWLRHDGNIRTGAVVAALEGAHAWLEAKIPGGRSLVNSVLVRADEPGEALAYWTSRYGRAIPKPVKRGIADAAASLYTQFSVIKYDSAAKGFRFADVIDLTHPTANGLAQNALFTYLLDQRHHNDADLREALPTLRRYQDMQHNLRTDRAATLRAIAADPELLRGAGMTWENLSSSGPMDAAAWQAIIPQMGYMALLRNLRNFEQAGVAKDVLKSVADRLADPEQVAKSRQLPFRFLSAYTNVQHGLWQSALEQALTYSCRNIPVLDGETVVLVDTSGSMENKMSQKSTVSMVAAGGLFGVALASAQGNAALYGFANGPVNSYRYAWDRGLSDGPFRHGVVQGAAVLRCMEAFVRRIGENGHGTDIKGSLAWAAQQHPKAARFVIITDMQCSRGNVGDGVPAHTPVYAFTLGAYAGVGMASSHNHHYLGGLTDHTFAMIRNIEAAQSGRWPWEQNQDVVA